MLRLTLSAATRLPHRPPAFRFQAPPSASLRAACTRPLTSSTASSTASTPPAARRDSAASTSPGAASASASGLAREPGLSAGRLELQALAHALHSAAHPPKLTFLLGGPGSGKGTLSALLAARAPCAHVSVGALLRTATSTGTARARTISATMSRGGTVSCLLATHVLLSHLAARADEEPAWVVDGFPRTFANAVMFDSLGLRPSLVVALQLDEADMRDRLTKRGRRDDVPYIVAERLVQFRSEWESIKEFYRRRNLLVEIDASGTPEQVWQRYTSAELPSLPPPSASSCF